jgi:endonuclease-3
MKTDAAVFAKTGTIWHESSTRRRQNVRRVCEVLDRIYGKPRHGNPKSPIDDLVYIVLTNKTSPGAARAAFQNLKRRFGNWDGVADAKLSDVRRLLKPAGLSDVKSRQLRDALRTIRRDFGKLSLSRLKRLSCREAEGYLTSLRGVSEKVAKCVMIYTLAFDVLPVDSHVHRLATRLGWTARKRADQCHAELEALVKPPHRAAFHAAGVAHGRRVCRPVRPRCDCCAIRNYCMYYKKGFNG